MNTAITTQPNEIYTIIDNSNLADSTKAQYKKALRNYLATGNSLADSKALTAYAQTVSKSSKAFLKSAIKLWTSQIALQTKAGSTPETVNAVTATLHRLDALNEAIQVKASKGQKAHVWLTQAEVKKLVAQCDDTLIGKRDRIVLSVLLGAGLRREELAKLRFSDIKQQGERYVLGVTGKGSKNRTVPISDKLASLLTEWQQNAPGRFVARSVGNNRQIGNNLSSVQIFRIVRQYGQRIDKPELATHDLRRTYAQLGYEAGVPITQISKLLGHSSVTITQRYLNLDLDLETTISDFIPL